MTLTLMSLQAQECPASRFQETDLIFRHRENEQKARTALDQYRDQFAKTPKDSEAGWRLSMAAYFVGFRFTSDPDLQKKLFEEGRNAGLTAAEKSPDCAGCHFWTAINMALYGQTVGIFRMLSSLKDIQAHLRTTLRLEPGYANGGAYRILGAIAEKLPGILGGSNRRAKEYFEKAIEVAPNEPLNYLFYAQLMKTGFRDEAEAERIVQLGLQRTSSAAEFVESREARAELARWRAPSSEN